MTLSTWIMGTLLRWFPHRARTGLRAIGEPNETGPVLVSGNYTLSVARLLRHLQGLDLWLLVVNSKGINVWCAACGGLLTEHQVISGVKTSMLAEKLTGRTLILPALSAPGVDARRVKEETGFRVRFGPVRAEDLRSYLGAGMKKSPEMMRVDFALRHRLDMVVSMNFIIWVPLAVLFGIFWPGQLIHLTLLFWGLALFSYILFPWIPGRTGWRKALVVALLVVVTYLLSGVTFNSDPVAYWQWMIGGVLLALTIGFDLAGTAGPMPSDAEAFVQRFGIRSLGSLFEKRSLGPIRLDEERCLGCYSICNDICPIGVYESDPETKKTVLARSRECFVCGACVKQCPTGALTLANSD
jgi:NAD-dependent dihydropyrimidine dehydrogenase PreA subunit